jgi:dihydroxy-acid dehydratase
MVWEGLRPRAILTEGAFRNAARVVLAQAGSINCIKHLQALALEAGVEIDMARVFDEEGGRVPVLTAVRPIGPLSIEQFEAAGGARAVMARLAPLLDTSALTVTGRTVAENLDGVTVADAEVIRPLDRPFGTEPAIVMLKGSLAPVSGVVKVGLRTPDRKLSFAGPAKVFDDTVSAEAALKAGGIVAGDVVVLRGLGVIGGPGMGGASRLVFAVEGRGLGAEVAVVTDGQLSGLVNKGLVVGEVQPEAALGGPIGLVRDGDRIEIDVVTKRIDLKIDPADLAARRAAWTPPAATTDSGWLSVYARTVTPLAQGASMLRRAVKKD